jgi:hypothetical protein
MAKSYITIKNHTAENVRIAVFKISYRPSTLDTIAWRVVAPPQQGLTKILLPSTYEVFINSPSFDDDRTDPYAGNQTQKISLQGNTGRFVVSSSKTLDRQSSTLQLALVQIFQQLVPEKLHIVNRSGFGVWSHITKGGTDIFPPRVITPGRELIEDLRPTYYLGTIAEFIVQGSKISEEQITSTPTPILAGETAILVGSLWTGYEISVNKL